MAVSSSSDVTSATRRSAHVGAANPPIGANSTVRPFLAPKQYSF